MKKLYRISIASAALAFLTFTNGRFLDLANLDQTLIDENLFSPLYNLTMEWGIYKPDLYFGVRNRQEHPLSVGMFWYAE
jgi:hypothetical protein